MVNDGSQNDKIWNTGSLNVGYGVGSSFYMGDGSINQNGHVTRMLPGATVMQPLMVDGGLTDCYVGRHNEIDALINDDVYQSMNVKEGPPNPTMTATMGSHVQQYFSDKIVSVPGTQEHFAAMPPACVDGKDIKNVALVPRIRKEESKTEEEGEVYVSDLVWGKVRRHPWWPGQIFEPSVASQKAVKCFKRDCYLIAFFGDKTFAWNKVSQIKPFRMYFNQMEKQSHMGAFCHAVDCSLDEVSRRIEFGLSCSCVPEVVQHKFKTQIVINAGIQPESVQRDGGDQLSTVDSFRPGVLLQHLKSIAVSPCYRVDRLGFVVARSQMLSFNRWKGYHKLPAIEEFQGLVGYDTRTNVSSGLDGSSALFSDSDSGIPSVKVKPTTRDHSFIPKGKNYDEETDRDVNILCSGNNNVEVSGQSEFGLSQSCVPKEVQYKSESQIMVNSSLEAEPSQRACSEVSEQLSMTSFVPVALLQYLKSLAVSPCSVTHKLGSVAAGTQLLAFSHWKGYNEPPAFKEFHGLTGYDAGTTNISAGLERGPVLFSTGDSFVPSGNEEPTISECSFRKRRRLSKDKKCSLGNEELLHGNISSSPNDVKDYKTLFPPLNDVLLKHSIAAKDPTDGYGVVAPLADLFSGLRDFTCENSKLKNDAVLVRECRGIGPSNEETNESSELDCIEDSYWTNRIIQGNPEQPVFYAPEARDAQNAPISLNPSAGEQERCAMLMQPKAEYPSCLVDREWDPKSEKASSPADVFLKLSMSAKEPTDGYGILAPHADFLSGARDFVCENPKSKDDAIGKCSSNDEITESSILDGVEDAYWTNRIIQGTPEPLVFHTLDSEDEKNVPVTLNPSADEQERIGMLIESPSGPVDGPKDLEAHQYEKIHPVGVVQLDGDDSPGSADGETEEDYPTELIMNFKNPDCVPLAADINKVFSQFGPIDESQTEGMHKTKRAKVVFKRRSDAETAFNGAGKYSFFGPSLISYRLNYAPKPRKVSVPNRGRKKKSTKQIESQE
ncbi:unnamed protein product [Cuscuta campestris]|uniref:PWWP domain-containing protein n=1 Tax=Cuscuta campestris TaxID=132261 RepID=A0A484N7F5_9ASTE|nr:unnamed protein product [Cuscuta campestris]